jgi:hypothetical protein
LYFPLEFFEEPESLAVEFGGNKGFPVQSDCPANLLEEEKDA